MPSLDIAGRRRASHLALALLLSAAMIGCGGGSPTSSNTTTAPSTSPIGSGSGTDSPGNPGTGGTDSLLQLVWQPNTDAIAGYIIYYGPTADTATVQASRLAIGSSGFNAQAPAANYYAARDLNLSQGSNVCFRLRAYNSSDTLSGWSSAACASI